MNNCSKAIGEWSLKVRGYRGTITRAETHSNTSGSQVLKDLMSFMVVGDNALKKLLTVETQHKAKAELVADDMKLINENATIVYNTVKVCNKKNAGLVSLFSV